MILRKDVSSLLDMARWISAFLVVLHHFRNNLFVGWEQLADKTIFAKVFYFVSLLGHESVMVFFVLSGFFVGGVD